MHFISLLLGFFFVVQNSQQNSIRALHTGETAMSTVRRPSAHRAYLREVSKQTTVVRLQGFLFFGTITNVEGPIRNLVEDSSWRQNPIRLLVVDLSLVYGVDMSAAEAFVRLQRLLSSKMVVLVFCGFDMDSAVGKSLNNVGLFNMEYVECFVTRNDAMECESPRLPTSPDTVSPTFPRERKYVSTRLVLLTKGRIRTPSVFVLTQNLHENPLTGRFSASWSTKWDIT